MKQIDDAETFCPHCHGYVGSAKTSEFVFCEGCGARLSLHDRTCPKCGRPAPGILSTESSSSDLAAGKTASFPRLTKSLIRSEAPQVEPVSAARTLDDSVDPSSTNVLDRNDLEGSGRPSRKRRSAQEVEDPYHPPRRSYRGLIVALVLVALVGGSAAFVALDPLGVMPGFYAWFREAAQEAFPSRQLGEAGDTAAPATDGDNAGDAGAGADGQDADEGPLTDDEVFERLSAAYDQVLAYDSDEAIGEVVDSFNSYYLEPDLEVRKQRSQSAYSLRDAIQQTIDDLDALEAPADTVYAEDIEHVRQLAEWMYGRVNQICESWDVSLSIPQCDSTPAVQDEILAPMREAGSSDLQNFDAHVGEWRPERK